jgi:hypothetical protein
MGTNSTVVLGYESSVFAYQIGGVEVLGEPNIRDERCRTASRAQLCGTMGHPAFTVKQAPAANGEEQDG